MISDIRRHAEKAGYEPWLFFRRGLDWRWISWQKGLEAAEMLEDRLLELGVSGPLGCPGFLDPRLVLALCATEARDLPIVSLGASYFPRELEREAQDKGCEGFWQLAPPDQGSRELGELPECLILPERSQGSGQRQLGRAGTDCHPERSAERGAEGSGRGKSRPGNTPPPRSLRSLPSFGDPLGRDDKQNASASLFRGVFPAKASDIQAAPGNSRDIAFLGSGLPDEVEQNFIRWTVKIGAALVLESRDDSVAAMVHWSRPTVAALPAQHLASLASGLLPAGQKDRRRLRRHFQRWRWTLVTDLHDKSMAEAHRAQILELLQLLGVELLP